MKYIMLIATAGLLAGCETPQQMMAKDQETCTAMAAGPETEGYPRCLQILAQYRDEQRQERSIRLMALGVAMQNASRSMQNASNEQANAPSGFTKVCTYNTIMGPRAITIGAIEMCPLIPPS